MLQIGYSATDSTALLRPLDSAICHVLPPDEHEMVIGAVAELVGERDDRVLAVVGRSCSAIGSGEFSFENWPWLISLMGHP